MEAEEHGLAIEWIFARRLFVGDTRVLDFARDCMNGTQGREKLDKMPF